MRSTLCSFIGAFVRNTTEYTLHQTSGTSICCLVVTPDSLPTLSHASLPDRIIYLYPYMYIYMFERYFWTFSIELGSHIGGSNIWSRVSFYLALAYLNVGSIPGLSRQVVGPDVVSLLSLLVWMSSRHLEQP